MILLKKAMDEVLKKVNLPSLYVERIERSGGLTQLCTPCGQPLMFIPDIRITHGKLTTDEREYIAKEINTFIMDNVETIKKALKIRLNPIEMKEYEGFEVTVNTNYGNGYNKPKQLSNVTIKVIDDTTKSSAYFKLSYTKMGVSKFSTSEYPEQAMMDAMTKIDEMKKIAKECFKTATKIHEEEALMAELNTCKN